MDKDENMEGCSNDGWSMDVGEREVVRWEIMSGVGGTINFQLILTLFPPLLLWAIRVLLFGVSASPALLPLIDLHVINARLSRRTALATLQIVTTALWKLLNQLLMSANVRTSH